MAPARSGRPARSCLALAAVVAMALGLSGWSFVPAQRASPLLRGRASASGALVLVPEAGLRAVQGAARRQGCTATRAVGLFFATQTGNTENVAGKIAEAAGIEAEDIGDIDADDLADYDGLIVGCPTWNTGADEMRSGTAWDDVLEDIAGLDLGGKPVAIFGCGDSQSYGENFCDGIEELHNTFKEGGGKMVGYVDASGYQHTESKSVKDGKFLGLPLDEDNESDETDGRVEKWVAQIKGEGMPL